MNIKNQIVSFLNETCFPLLVGVVFTLYSYILTGWIIQFLVVTRMTWVPHIILGIVFMHWLRYLVRNHQK